MTISNQTQQISYTAVGSAGEAFTIPFSFDDDDEIRLLEAGVLQTAGTVYTVTGAGTDAGGTATYDSALNPQAGATIILARILPLTQATELGETGRFSAESVEAQLDREIMTLQQMLGLNSTDGQTYDAGTKRIENVVDPTSAQDAATQQYVQDQISGTGNVPAPGAGDVGSHLEATAADTFGWVVSEEVPTPVAADVTNASVIVATSAAVNGYSFGTVPAAGGRAVNLLLNGSFRIAQNGTSFTGATTPINSDDTLLLDRWRLLSEDTTDAADISQETTIVPDGALNSMKVEIVSADNKLGFVQILEAEDTARAFNGGNGKVSLSFEAYLASGSATLSALRVGILSWVGTADTVTSDVVDGANWAAAGTNPTLATSWAYENVPANFTLVDDEWTTFTEVGIELNTSGTKNLAIFIWIDDADVTAGDILYISNVQLVMGDRVDSVGHRPISDELRMCQRYLQVFAATAADQYFGPAHPQTTAIAECMISFLVPMRVAPSAVTVLTASTDFQIADRAASEPVNTSLVFTNATVWAAKLTATQTDTWVAGDSIMLESANANAKLIFSAEL